MQGALDELDKRGIAYEFDVRSAHRQPDAVAEYARTARERGLRVLICGAGLSAALPGVAAAHTDLPVIGVPLRSSPRCSTGSTRCSRSRRCRRACRSRPSASTTRRNAAVLAARILGAWPDARSRSSRQQLVAIDSVNPGLFAGAAGERELAASSRDWCEQRGLERRARRAGRIGRA